MNHFLTSFYRVVIITITIYLIFMINKDSINNKKLFIKRFMISLTLTIICSTIMLVGIIFNHFIYHILNDNINAAINCLMSNSLKKANYILFMDSVILIIVPSTLITVYSFYANDFKRSLTRSVSASILIFLMADLITIILDKEPSSTFNVILLTLFNDIFGGIIFGFVIAITLFYYKRLFIDADFDRNIRLFKYNKLLITLALGSIFIYFIFFYRTYNNFYLMLNDYDLFKYKYFSKTARNKIKVIIPTSGIYIGYEGDLPFSFNWDYKDKQLTDKKTRIRFANLNLKKYGELFKDKKISPELIPQLTKEDVYDIFNYVISKTIEPGEIKVAGDKSLVIIRGEKEIIIELTIPCGIDIAIFKDMKKWPSFTKAQKYVFEQIYSPIYSQSKFISVIGTNHIFDAKILNTKKLLLSFIDTKENRKDLKEYKIKIPINQDEIIIPSKEMNNVFLLLNDSEQDKDIILPNIQKGCLLEIDANSLIAELFNNHEVNDILMTNIVGKLNYIDKEVTFNKGDILSIKGNKLTISQITQGGLTITGQSRKIIVNNQEIGRTIYSSLSGGIQILSAIIIATFAILTFVFSFVVDKKSKKSKKDKKEVN